MQTRKISKYFKLTGCFIHTFSLFLAVLIVIEIIKGFANAIGGWSIALLFISLVGVFLVGGGLGNLCLSYGQLLVRLRSCNSHKD